MNAKLAYLAWRLKMKLDVHKDSLKEPLNDSEFIRAYDQGKSLIVDDVYDIAKEILEIANQESKVKFLEEDVDLSGNLGQEVDEYA